MLVKVSHSWLVYISHISINVIKKNEKYKHEISHGWLLYISQTSINVIKKMKNTNMKNHLKLFII